MAAEIDYETWLQARRMLTGEDPDAGVSPKTVAAACGLTMHQFLALVARSRLKDPEDEVWVWDIADVYDNRYALQGQTMEDEGFRRAMKGVTETKFKIDRETGELIPVEEKVKLNDAFFMRHLERRDPSYRKNVVINGDDDRDPTPDEAFNDIDKTRRLREARGEDDEVTPKRSRFDA